MVTHTSASNWLRNGLVARLSSWEVWGDLPGAHLVKHFLIFKKRCTWVNSHVGRWCWGLLRPTCSCECPHFRSKSKHWKRQGKKKDVHPGWCHRPTELSNQELLYPCPTHHDIIISCSKGILLFSINHSSITLTNNPTQHKTNLCHYFNLCS